MTLKRHGAAGERWRPKILCVDDEPQVLEGLRDSLREFEVSVATSGAEGLQLLRGDPTGFSIVISDMRMPNMGGADFLRAARVVAPDAVRMLLTGHADLQDAIRAVNGARLFRFLAKPCDPTELLRRLRRCAGPVTGCRRPSGSCSSRPCAAASTRWPRCSRLPTPPPSAAPAG